MSNFTYPTATTRLGLRINSTVKGIKAGLTHVRPSGVIKSIFNKTSVASTNRSGLRYGVARSNSQGSPPSSLQMHWQNTYGFRVGVAPGTTLISIDVRQDVIGTVRPSVTIRANADVGFTRDVVAYALPIAGWTTIGPIPIIATDFGGVWVEIDNNWNAPCHWDNISIAIAQTPRNCCTNSLLDGVSAQSSLTHPLTLQKPASTFKPLTSPSVLATSQFPVSPMLKCESSDFDGQTQGTAVPTWLDTSGNGHNWTGTNVIVDYTKTLNGHPGLQIGTAAIRYFVSSNTWLQSHGITGTTGMEMCIVAQRNVYPPTNQSYAGTLAVFNYDMGGSYAHFPWTDGYVYEWFGSTGRVQFAQPTTPLTQPFYWLVSVKSGSRSDWIKTTPLYTSASYNFTTHLAETKYQIGVGNGGNYAWDGSIFAIYMWPRQLTDSERTTLRTYITSKWGVT